MHCVIMKRQTDAESTAVGSGTMAQCTNTRPVQQMCSAKRVHQAPGTIVGAAVLMMAIYIARLDAVFIPEGFHRELTRLEMFEGSPFQW